MQGFRFTSLMVCHCHICYFAGAVWCAVRASFQGERTVKIVNLKSVLAIVFAIFCFTGFSAHAVDEFFGIKPITLPIPIVPPVQDTYFTIKPDFRRCVAPICGGWFVNAVNRKMFKCLDGTVKKECYVGTEKINIPGLSNAVLAELRQAMGESKILIQGHLSNAIAYGVLEINNAWLSASDQSPDGKFVNVTDNGIRCITEPCPRYDGQILNRYLIKSLAGYDLSMVEANDEQLARARAAVNSENGLPMAGRFVEVTGPVSSAQGIAASQFYLKVENTKPKMCAPTGCSGQVCSDTDVITTCEWRPEYACFRSASCSTQDNGDCGWVMDDELRRCLANAAFSPFSQPGVAE